jgi:hypothetical protein
MVSVVDTNEPATAERRAEKPNNLSLTEAAPQPPKIQCWVPTIRQQDLSLQDDPKKMLVDVLVR